MKITQKEAKMLCNSVELRLISDSLSPGIDSLNVKKIKTRMGNCAKAIKYWNNRYQVLEKSHAKLKKAKIEIPILPALKKENFKKKNILFQETYDRFKKQLTKLEKQQSVVKTSSKKRK
ncbi:hypothetical protein [Leptospira sp. GIMC2001]|uniref:hypothetical protein n=1 Tax=Leptospira sp. GIMC2001 TaxID=1513297 RepID=UPI00234BFD24|nr:hypothetical protein [Leptospira sp. GIMC2001]WCL48053.1 hypothetical protein O4O04_12075 [Leptospira sp. GIMC2001]